MIDSTTFFSAEGPRVAGTITRHTTLSKQPRELALTCDLVEVRLDMVGSVLPGWLDHCRKLEHAGHPVLLTLRLEAEGGRWTAPDGERMPFLSDAVRELAFVDVEYCSTLVQPLCSKADRLGKMVIVSFHDFDKTPAIDELQKLVDGIRELPAAVPKIVTMVQDTRDIDVLSALLQANANEPICVLGMGAAGAATRVDFPRQGSCLTYGFIDGASAPGQPTAGELVETLCATHPPYAAYREGKR